MIFIRALVNGVWWYYCVDRQGVALMLPSFMHAGYVADNSENRERMENYLRQVKDNPEFREYDLQLYIIKREEIATGDKPLQSLPISPGKIPGEVIDAAFPKNRSKIFSIFSIFTRVRKKNLVIK